MLQGLRILINVNAVVYKEAIRYDKLFALTKRAFAYCDDNELNIFIDLYPILRSLYKPDYLEFKNPVDLCSCIINLGAHYKYFFRSYFQTESKVYLINSLNLNKNNIRLYPEYNKEFKHRYETRTPMVDAFVNQNIDLIDTIVSYLPNMYLINSTYESSVVIYDLINKFGNNKPNLIISRDLYPRQLIGLCNRTVLYRSKQDRSYYVCKKNLYRSIIYDYKLNQDHYNFDNWSPKLLSLLFTLNKLECRKIKCEHTIPVAKAIIDRALNDMIIRNDYNSIIDYSKLTDKDPYYMNNRFNVIDIPSQYNIYKNDIESTTYNISDLYDPKSVRYICETYFNNMNQIDLNAF